MRSSVASGELRAARKDAKWQHTHRGHAAGPLKGFSLAKTFSFGVVNCSYHKPSLCEFLRKTTVFDHPHPRPTPSLRHPHPVRRPCKTPRAILSVDSTTGCCDQDLAEVNFESFAKMPNGRRPVRGRNRGAPRSKSRNGHYSRRSQSYPRRPWTGPWKKQRDPTVGHYASP